MKFTNFASLTREYTGTNSTTLTDARILVLANTFKDEIAQEIAKTNEDYFVIEEYADLVAGQRQYPLDDAMLNGLKSAFAQLRADDTDYTPLKEYDINSIGIAKSEASIISYMAGRKPGFDIFDRSVYLLTETAIEDVDEGLRMLITIYPADFTDLSLTTDMAVNPSSTTHGFPRPFHELLARKISIFWKGNRDKPIALSPLEQNYAEDFKSAIESIRHANLDREIIASVPQDDGQDY